MPWVCCKTWTFFVAISKYKKFYHMLQGQMFRLLDFVCQVFLACFLNNLTFYNHSSGQEGFHIPLPFTGAEVIWQILCARATFSLSCSAFTDFQSAITNEMNFWELSSFPFMARVCVPSLALYELLSLWSEPVALASAWGSLVHSPVRALGFFLSAHTGEKRTPTSMAGILISNFVKFVIPTSISLAEPCSRGEDIGQYV